jgi:hypothetical protein
MLNVSLVLTDDEAFDKTFIRTRLDDNDVTLEFSREWKWTDNGDNISATERVNVYLTREKAAKLAEDLVELLNAKETE